MPERLWVALDVETLKEADGLLERLAGAGPPETMGAKIGSQLFTAAGPAAVETALKRGFPVFLDLKFHDIPNTVAGAVREATRIGVAMLAGPGGGDRPARDRARRARRRSKARRDAGRCDQGGRRRDRGRPSDHRRAGSQGGGGRHPLGNRRRGRLGNGGPRHGPPYPPSARAPPAQPWRPSLSP